MIKNFILSLFISGTLFAQSEAYDALKVFEPFIGEWFSKHKSIGAFEGLPKINRLSLLQNMNGLQIKLLLKKPGEQLIQIQIRGLT